MQAKLLMRWNIRPETESEYFEFLVHEFIPGMGKLGIAEIQVWYTAFGNCEKKLASGITDNAEQMKKALHSKLWKDLTEKLDSYVEDYSLKVIPATGGFQL